MLMIVGLKYKFSMKTQTLLIYNTSQNLVQVDPIHTFRQVY